jgi:hypothetical protein
MVTHVYFTHEDMAHAMKASNFNNGIDSDGFDFTILMPGDISNPPPREGYHILDH